MKYWVGHALKAWPRGFIGFSPVSVFALNSNAISISTHPWPLQCNQWWMSKQRLEDKRNGKTHAHPKQWTKPALLCAHKSNSMFFCDLTALAFSQTILCLCDCNPSLTVVLITSGKHGSTTPFWEDHCSLSDGTTSQSRTFATLLSVWEKQMEAQ